MSGPSRRQVGLRTYLRIRWRRILRAWRNFTTEPVLVFFFLLAVSALVVFLLTVGYDPARILAGRNVLGLYHDPEFWHGVLVEAHGMLLDVLILGLLFAILSKIGERKLENRRYQNEIRDYADWGAEEAVRRIVGNVRRLNRNGKTEIDLRDCVLAGANLAPYAIDERSRKVRVRLRGAVLYRADLSGANLRRVDLAGANLYRANLSGADLTAADLTGASLHQTRLAGAVLDKASLRGADKLTSNQLLSAGSLAEAEIDDELLEKMKARDPGRFRKLVGDLSEG